MCVCCVIKSHVAIVEVLLDRCYFVGVSNIAESEYIKFVAIASSANKA